MTQKNYASWSISLDVWCPYCEHEFNLLESYVDLGCDPIEHGTSRTEDYEVLCPKCEHEFLVDFQY